MPPGINGREKAHVRNTDRTFRSGSAPPGTYRSFTMLSTLSLTRRRVVAACAAAFLSLSLLVMTPVAVFAAGGVQGNLTGSVQDASSGKPLADVRVAAQSQSGSFTGST